MGSHPWGVSVSRRIEHNTGESQLVQHSMCSEVISDVPLSRWAMQTIPFPLLCPRHAQMLSGPCQLTQDKTVPEMSWQAVWVAIYTPAAVATPLPEAVTCLKQRPKERSVPLAKDSFWTQLPFQIFYHAFELCQWHAVLSKREACYTCCLCLSLSFFFRKFPILK